ncbi:bifunctional metallophosphatase/5'-nucleotidase [Virgibacillus alimentarius]|uniref:2',3'-cyclic-nucleotide 2'-phosphodiesterase (5'-nucleotidase family) n=1 Tax=Virgibacillus alimentarius TaxID=698769 RepID=A0ABS4S8X3_9BACI|nr:bifunctional UDP-sugar hydrolase/5'-nucleotidase [Virgibacillus alimentarius]MBP2257329.1 2',3'-cyclic-nucleotide 2'-phosphodiesterase (5'-nucleotidase family) [Virgibacillus alimentarius]
MKERIYMYYTNDLHSNFKQWPRVAGYFKNEKAKREAEHQSCWIIDIGDHLDRVHPIAEAFKGKANVQLMNDAGYDIVTLGNNEGITLAHEDLFHLYDKANFQVVCSNLKSMRSLEPEWLQPTVHLQSVKGVKIGVIGLTAPFNAFYNLLDWHVEAPFHTLEKYINELEQVSDIIILLSHLGLNEDQEIARRFSAIDVIIGGHTHHLLRRGEEINNTIITAAGKHCSFVGEVILTWDHDLNKLVNKEAYATDITHYSNDLQAEQSLLVLNKEADRLLGDPIIHMENPIEVKWFQHTEIMQKLTDTLKNWTNADCAMLNAGLLMDQLGAGDVTFKDIHRICPHPINPCIVQLSGDELLKVIRASFTKEFTELKLRGFGFRGEVLGRMIFSGLTVKTLTRSNGEEYVEKVTFQGEELVKDNIYRVATADTFTFGRLLPEIAKSSTKQFFLPEFIRDLLAYTLVQNFA